jgi:hypothetical protein
MAAPFDGNNGEALVDGWKGSRGITAIGLLFVFGFGL